MNGRGITEDRKQFQLIDKSLYVQLCKIFKHRLPVSFQLYNVLHFALSPGGNVDEIRFEFYTYHGHCNALLNDDSVIVGCESMRNQKEDKGTLIAFLSVSNPETVTKHIAQDFAEYFSDGGKDFDLSFAIERNTSPLVTQALLNKGYVVTIRSCNMVIIDITENEASTTTNGNNNTKGENGKVETHAETETETLDYIVKPLSPEEGKLVASYWRYGNWHNPVYYATSCIEKFPSCGIYSKETGELMSWAICYNFCSIGMLHTPPKFRGRGLAKVVMRCIIDELIELGLYPGTGVEPRNVVSANIMSKLGFKNTHAMDFIFTS